MAFDCGFFATFFFTLFFFALTGCPCPRCCSLSFICSARDNWATGFCFASSALGFFFNFFPALIAARRLFLSASAPPPPAAALGFVAAGFGLAATGFGLGLVLGFNLADKPGTSRI